jgi:hypothetical protein
MMNRGRNEHEPKQPHVCDKPTVFFYAYSYSSSRSLSLMHNCRS